MTETIKNDFTLGDYISRMLREANEEELNLEEMASVPIDPEVALNMDSVSNMLRVAGEAGLTVEVVLAFGEEMASGRTSVPEACVRAMYEWDC